MGALAKERVAACTTPPADDAKLSCSTLGKDKVRRRFTTVTIAFQIKRARLTIVEMT